MANSEPIPQEFIKQYVDTLLTMASRLEANGTMYEATLLRADHAMDLVKAWRHSRNPASNHSIRAEGWGG